MARSTILLCLLVVLETNGRCYKSGKEPFELNEYLEGTFGTKSFNGSWISGDVFVYRDANGDYTSYDMKTQTSTPFLSQLVLKDYPGATISISNDQQYILIRYNVSSVFRHSTTALYTIHDIRNGQYYDIAAQNHTQLVQWAPTGHSLVYVFENNIFYLENPEDVANPIPITTDGVPGIIYNGVPDWVYEEEVLGSGSALWFSPDSKRISFASFNDTQVREFDYFIYGKPGSLEAQYPKLAAVRYPKVGTENPTVQTYIAELATGAVKQVDAIPQRFLPEDYVLYDMTWVTNDEVAVISTNRVQNQAELTRCNMAGICRPEAAYEETKGWLDARIPKYNAVGSHRIEILPQPQSDDVYDHIVITDIDNAIVQRLTEGKFSVTTILGWDEPNCLIFFGGSGEDAPSQQHVYSVSTIDLELTCLTCEMETPEGYCQYATAAFSKDFSYVTKICQGPGPFIVQIEQTEDPSNVVVWEDNQELRDKLALKALPLVKDLKVPISDGFEARVRLLLPADLDQTSGARKYPAVVNVYGGPDSNQIRDSYSSGFEKYIVSNRQYIYIFIDGRGSGRDGKNKMFTLYRNLATVEIEDQITVTKYLQENLPYIDANNTGIWGWSYGGFATAWTLVKDTGNVFKFGLSVAPVTSFIYYDSIYTERYMGLPTEDDNLAGYNNTDITRNVEALRGKLFFLIHGNADDNVHYQQSMLLSRALELADVPFKQQSYPDENHSLGGVSPHLYHTIDRFWARSFNLPDPPAPALPKEAP